MHRLLFFAIAVGLAVGLLAPSLHAPGASMPASERRDTIVYDGPERPDDASRLDAQMMASAGGPIVIERGYNGHFFVTAEINGVPIELLVDTGASGVALTTEDAQKIGLQFAPDEFVAIGSGASGPVYGKSVTLDRVSLEGKSAEHVSGSIIEGGEISLLGQSFLRRMGTIEISGDRMTIS